MLRKIAATALVVSLVGPTPASADETIKYSYDARGRLIRLERDPAHTSVNTNVVSCYKYDKADNRARVKVTTTTTPLPACPS